MALSDLTPEQQQAFQDRLKELQMDPSKCTNITPETHKGRVVLSADPAESSVPPHLVTLTSIEDVKRLAGNPDSDYEDGTLEHHHPDLPEWPAHKNDMDREELTAEENNRIVAAEHAYVFGHSKRFQSYRTIIDKHKFPASFAVFCIPEMCIDASNSPVVIKPDTCYNIGTLTICDGGMLKFEGTAHMTVQKMVRSDKTSC